MCRALALVSPLHGLVKDGLGRSIDYLDIRCTYQKVLNENSVLKSELLYKYRCLILVVGIRWYDNRFLVIYAKEYEIKDMFSRRHLFLNS